LRLPVQTIQEINDGDAVRIHLDVS
jgi:hypothetical protein